MERRVEEGVHISLSAPLRLRQVWLQHRCCLSPCVWRAPQLWVPEETCCYLRLEEEKTKTEASHIFTM